MVALIRDHATSQHVIISEDDVSMLRMWVLTDFWSTGHVIHIYIDRLFAINYYEFVKVCNFTVPP